MDEEAKMPTAATVGKVVRVTCQDLPPALKVVKPFDGRKFLILENKTKEDIVCVIGELPLHLLLCCKLISLDELPDDATLGSYKPAVLERYKLLAAGEVKGNEWCWRSVDFDFTTPSTYRETARRIVTS